MKPTPGISSVQKKGRRPTRTDRGRVRARDAFLKALRETGNISESCRIASLPRTTAKEWRAKDEAFRQAWDEALEVAIDGLELEARRRAVDGVLEPVYQGGKKVGTIRRYSDRMLEILLKGHRPEKYRERFDAPPPPPVPDDLKSQRSVMEVSRRVAFVLGQGMAAMLRQRAVEEKVVASVPAAPEAHHGPEA